MASKTTRRWEKPVSAAQAPTAPTVITVDTILDGLNEHEKACHRQAFLHLIQSLPGTDVDINVVDGRTVRGQFYTATPFPGEEFKVVVKGAKELKNNAPISGDIEALSTVFTNFKDISTIRTAKLDLQHKSYSSEFQTDSSIKKHGDLSFLEGRELQSVSNSWLDPSTNTDLGGGSTGHWDQFEANKRLFKVTSSFDENLYTKKLDMKSMTKEQIARAERIAKEIENSASSNIHLQEERGQALERDIDEEERFSGVVRTPAIVVPAKTENAWARGSKIITQSGATTPLGGKKTSPVKGGRPVSTTEQPPQQQRSEKPAMLSAPPNLPPPPLRPVPGLSKTVPVVETAPAAVAKVEESPVVVAVAETPAAAPETPAAPAVEAKSEASSEASAASKKLSATAKEFKFNPSASSWTPKASVPAFVPAAQQQAFVPQTFVPQQFVPPAQPFVPATPVYAAVPQSYAPVPASPMTPGSFVPPQTPPHGAVPHGVMSSPVVSAMTPGNFNNYQQPQQLQTPVNTAVPGSNYKSPSQPPSITQSPSVGSMPVPTQPNFTPLPVYQQLPPDQNFAMQQFGVGVDPNLQLQHMASPQQVAQQWVQGAPVQTPNGMMVAAQQQGFQQQQLFPPQFMPQMANLSPEQQQQQQQFMLQQQMQPVQVVINGEVQTVMQPVYNIALQQQLMQQQSQQMQMMDQQQFAQMHAQMAMMNMQMPMYMAQPVGGYMPQQFAQAYNPQQPQGFQPQQQQQQQGAPQQQPGANTNPNNQQPGGVNQHSGNQGGGYNNNYNNNGQGQNNFRANSNTGGRGGGNKFGNNNNNRDYNNRGDGNREGSHSNNRGGGGGYQNRGNNSQPGTPNGGNRNNYNNRGDNNNNGSNNSNSSNNTTENAAVATVMLPSETAQATNAPAGEPSK